MYLLQQVWPRITPLAYSDFESAVQFWAARATMQQMSTFLLGLYENCVAIPFPVKSAEYLAMCATPDMQQRVVDCTKRLAGLSECEC